MIPRVNDLTPEAESSTSTPIPTRTYMWDRSTGRVMGMVDGLKAMEQVVHKILDTERYEFIIEDSSYGLELQDLVGKDIDYVKADIGRRITEALTQDQRIKEVNNIRFSNTDTKDEIKIYFEVVTVEGVISVERGFRV